MEVMIDIETLASESLDAAVVQVGAVAFSLETCEVFADTARRFNVAWDSTDPAFGVMDAETLHWWMQQSAEARASVTACPRVTGKNCCLAFHDWVLTLRGHEPRVWAAPAHFDIPRLQSMFRRYGVSWPFERFRQRCSTSLVKTLGLPAPPRRDDETEHDAMFDAIYQARVLCETLRAWKEEVTGWE